LANGKRPSALRRVLTLGALVALIGCGPQPQTLSPATPSSAPRPVLPPTPAPPGESRLAAISPENVDQLAQHRLVAGRTGAGYAVAFSPDLSYVAWGDYKGTVNLQRVAAGTLTTLRGSDQGSAVSLQFSGDGHTLAVGLDDGKILLWEVPAGKLRRALQGTPDWIKYVAISGDGSVLAATTQGRILQVWRATDGTLLQTFSAENDQLSGAFMPVAVSDDGAMVAASPGGAGTRVWRVADWSVLADLPDATTILAFSRDGRLLATSSTVYSLPSGHRVAGYAQGGSIAFSPNGKLLAVGGLGVRLIDVSGARELNRLDANEGNIAGLAFSADGSTLATASLGKKTARLWRVGPPATGQGDQPATAGPEAAPGLPGSAGPGGPTGYPMNGDVVKTGEKKSIKLVVDDADNVKFILMSGDINAGQGKSGGTSKLVFSVRGPNGETVSSEAPTQYGYCSTGGFQGLGICTCSVDNPSAGTWEAIVEARQAPGDGVAFFVQTQFEGGVQIVPELSKSEATTGERVELKATLQDPAPVTGAYVEAWIVAMPGSSDPTFRGSVKLAERGDGVYNGDFTPASAGRYNISFSANGRNSRGHDFVRQETALLDVQAAAPR
jgi:WD40 repeat protein